MKKFLISTAMAFAFAMPAWAKDYHVCTVADPTGTPLNVRTLPNKTAKTVFDLDNGTMVVVLDEQGQWVFINALQKVSENAENLIGAGWVWLPYLNCVENISKPKKAETKDKSGTDLSNTNNLVATPDLDKSQNTLEADLLELIKQRFPNVDINEELYVDQPHHQVVFYIPTAHMACFFSEKPLKIFNCRTVHA